ncbi:MAG TPA: hypothetical protein VFJ72_04470 [Rubrobacteraceae bacterium]|nr:hypothetical protein [Rubrobacteraceae bacterium]
MILIGIVVYAAALAAFTLAGHEDTAPDLWLPIGALAGYAIGYFASRSPGHRGESEAYVLFFVALGALAIAAVIIVVSPPDPNSAPWMMILGFLMGVMAANYVRLKYPPTR